MAAHSIILFAGDRSWRVGVWHNGAAELHDVALPDQAPPAEIARCIDEGMARHGYRGASVIFALPSSWCLSARIDTSALRKPDRKTLLFMLEEKLPLAAEQITADFIHADGSSLGVCVQTAQVRPLIDALETTGIHVQSITPAALLACQSILQRPIPDQVLIWSDDGQVGILAFAGGALRSWALAQPDPADLVFQTRLALGANSTAAVIALDLPQDLAGALRNGQLDFVDRPETLTESAVRSAGEISAGGASPWIELRRDALAPSDSMRLYRRSLELALAAAIALFLTLAAAMFIRGERYGGMEQDAEQAMQIDFHAAFPAWPPPASVRHVLESELRKRQSAAAPLPASTPAPSALDVLHSVLSRFPRDVRCTIEQATFAPESVDLSGRLHSYADSDAIAGALRSAGLDVPPPQLRRENDGRWRFSVAGRRVAAPREGAAE